MKFIFIVIFIGLLAVLAVSQQSLIKKDNDKIRSQLLDIPSAKYQFAASNGGIQICNFTRLKIEGFRPGCVKRKNNQLMVLSERDFEKSEIAAAKEEEGSCLLTRNSNGSIPYGGECKQGKLAIIEVALDNGTTWKLVP